MKCYLYRVSITKSAYGNQLEMMDRVFCIRVTMHSQVKSYKRYAKLCRVFHISDKHRMRKPPWKERKHIDTYLPKALFQW